MHFARPSEANAPMHEFSAASLHTPRKTYKMADDSDNSATSEEEREAVIDEVISYLLRRDLGKLEREETRIERLKRRNLRRRRQRQQMFEIPHNTNQHIASFFRGHPEKLRIETRLTLYQFETLATWLKDNTNLEASRYANINTKLAIFLYICGQGCSYRGASIH